MSKQALLNDKSIEELTKDLSSKKKELFEARVKLSSGQSDDCSVFKKIKKDIARINTAISFKSKA